MAPEGPAAEQESSGSAGPGMLRLPTEDPSHSPELREPPISVLLADGTLLTGADFEPVGDREGVLRCTRSGILLRATITSEAAYGGMVHQLTVQNVGFGRIPLARLSPLSLVGSDAAPGGLEGVAVWLQGPAMNNPVLSHRFASGEDHSDLQGAWFQESVAGRTFASAWLLISGEPDNDQQTLLGFITTARQLADIRLLTDRTENQALGLDCDCALDGWVLGPGESVASEKLLVLGPGPAVDLAEQYASATAAEMLARVPDRIPTGWCTGYAFHNRISEADVLANLDAILSRGRPVEVLQIDDGCQAAIGDWLETDERFPGGMAALAARIHASGLTAGIWLAPLVMQRDSRLLAEHPDWTVRDEHGETIFVRMWLGEVAVLDCTHPEAQAWLRDLIHTVTAEWGYRYLKLDALQYACQPDGRYYASNTTAATNLRRGLEVVRAAAGEEVFILGCTCPVGPAIGLVDARCAEPDVREVRRRGQRPSVRHTLRLALPRWYMHRRLWLNDAGCLIVREDTSLLTEEEARSVAAGMLLSGGLLVLGDDIARLSEPGWQVARSALPPGRRGTPSRSLAAGDPCPLCP